MCNRKNRQVITIKELIYAVLVNDKSLYSNTLVKLPTPNFLVFYNGQAHAPERSILRLSDSFEVPVDDPELELKVTVLNINPGNNPKLLDSCPPLKEYMLYIEKVRSYAKILPIQEAVWQSVQECIHEGILTRFLTKYRNEAIRMSIFECDIERELKLIRQDEFNAGFSQGINETKKKMALKMLKMEKLAMEEIAEYSELSIEEVEQLVEFQAD